MKTLKYFTVTAAIALFTSCSTHTPDTTLTGAIKEWKVDQDDSKARIELRNATHRANSQGQSKQHEIDLLYALENSSNKKVKTFLIHELKLVGGIASIKPLSNYLLDDELCSHATQALLAINNAVDGAGEGLFSEFTVTDALEEALVSASGKNLLYIVKTLGSLKNFDDETLDRLHGLTSSKDKVLKHTAVRAVAEKADEKSSTTMLRAIKGESAYNRSKMVSLNLLYAENLDSSTGEAHALKVMSMVDKNKEVHLFVKCLATMQNLKGDSFTDDLISYLDDSNLRLAVAVVRLLSESNDSSINGKLTEMFSKGNAAFQAQALKVLVSRKAPKSGFLISKSLQSPDQSVRNTAIILSSEATAEDVVDELLNLILNGTSEDKSKAATALSRFTAKEVAGSMITSYRKANPQGKSLLLSIMASKKNSALAEVAMQATLDSDSGVRRTAYKALKNIATPEQASKIITIMTNTESSSDLKGLKDALVAASSGNADSVAKEVIQNIKKGASSRSNLSLIQVLPRIGGITAFKGLLKLYPVGSETVQKEVIRALAKWTSDKQFNPLLTFAGKMDGSNKVLLIRGLSALVVNSEKSTQDKRNMLMKISRISSDDEKKRILELMNKLK